MYDVETDVAFRVEDLRKGKKKGGRQGGLEREVGIYGRLFDGLRREVWHWNKEERVRREEGLKRGRDRLREEGKEGCSKTLCALDERVKTKSATSGTVKEETPDGK